MGMDEWDRLANLCAMALPTTPPKRTGGWKEMLPGGILAERRGDLLHLKAP